MKYLLTSGLMLLFLFLITTESDTAEDSQLVIACETESQIFVISHAWKYHGFNEAQKVFASYVNPGDNGEAPVCFSVEIATLHYLHYAHTIWLPSAGWEHPYTIYQSATDTKDSLQVLMMLN